MYKYIILVDLYILIFQRQLVPEPMLHEHSGSEDQRMLYGHSVNEDQCAICLQDMCTPGCGR